MAERVVRLGVDPRPAEEGHRRYQQATQASIQSTEALDQSQRRNMMTLAEFDRLAADPYIRATRERVQANLQVRDALHSEALAMNRAMSSTTALTSASSSATTGLSRLNFSLASVARQAIGVHPAFGQLGHVMSTFAVGSVATVGILAGLAAIGGAIRLLGREAREAEEALAGAREVLDRLAPDTELQESVSEVRARYEENVARFLQLNDPEYRRRELGRVTEGGLTVAQMDREQYELLQQMGADRLRLARGDTAVGEQDQGEMVARARALQERIGFVMAEVDERITEQILDDRRQAETDYQRELSAFLREQAAENLTAPPTIDVTSLSFRKQAEEQQLQLMEEQARASERLAELERERVRANVALIHSLRAVGQAYGGVTEQIAALASAALSLDRMPMESTEDKARGYASAALMGIGYGASTGNPALGGLGGGLSGFAVAGPAGAVVGAVGGIVSGLIEQGRRAELAARAWQRSFEAFELMFDDLTPLEQDIIALEKAFTASAEQLRAVHGMSLLEPTIEEARAYLDLIAGTGMTEYDRELQRLVDAYDDNAKQAREAREAEEALAETRRDATSALNSPSGLRLSLYRWLASGEIGDGPDGGKGDEGFLDWPDRPRDRFNDPGGRDRPDHDPYAASVRVDSLTINVSGAGDPEMVAESVVRQLQAEALLGGPDPFEVYAR